MFKRIFSLIRKTGSRVIIIDPETDDAFVVTPLDHYEDTIDPDGAFDSDVWRDGMDALPDDEDGEEMAESYPAWEEPVREPAFAPKSADLTENQLIDKINLDIARWQEEQKAREAAQASQLESQPEPGQSEQSSSSFLNEITLAPLPEQEAPGKEGEEKFYIEPVG